MTTILSKTWALFFGFAIICLAHGLQGTLIGVRSVIEGFGFFSTGVIVAGYYVGYLSGSLLIPILLRRVGHIRVFAALASLASIAILLHSVLLDPYSWFCIRILNTVNIARANQWFDTNHGYWMCCLWQTIIYKWCQSYFFSSWAYIRKCSSVT